MRYNAIQRLPSSDNAIHRRLGLTACTYVKARSLLAQLQRRWFLLALLAVMLLGYTQAEPLAALADAGWLRNCIVATVMFVMALPLSIEAMARSVTNPVPLLLAVAMNVVAVPLAAVALYGPMNFYSNDFANGLLIVGATPCTLASAAVWTRRAGGNDAVALMVTVATNLGCFVVSPLVMLLTAGKQAETEVVNFWAMATKLLLLVVAPMILGQLLRLHQGAADWAAKRKTMLGVVAQIGILMMVTLGSIGAGREMGGDLSRLLGPAVAVMAVLVVVIHVGVLLAGILLAKAARQSRADQIAVGIAGSQKTLMIGLQMSASYFPGTLAMLPLIAYHAGQLLADTLIVDWWRKQGDAASEEATG